jgi:hypothetical protein
MNRLSNSAVNKYLECGKKYEFHYKMRLRDPTKSAALVFGDAMDSGLNSMAMGLSDYQEAFNRKFEFNKFEGSDIEEFIPDNTKLRYADSDFDKDLLTEEDEKNIEQKCDQLGFGSLKAPDIIKLVFDRKKAVGYNNMHNDEVKLFNFINWLSLKRKAPIMFEAYKKHVLPRIKKVHQVQKYIEITNHDGDKVIGYIDMIIDFELDDGRVVKLIADNKTSSMEYERDAVIKSQQLIIYCIAENISHAAFFVIRKGILKNKTKVCNTCGHNGIKDDGRLTTAKSCDSIINGSRCHGEWTETIAPEAKVEIRVDEIKDYNKNLVIETLDHVNKGISNGVFPRNFAACGNWGGCQYRQLCFYGKQTGLVKVEK